MWSSFIATSYEHPETSSVFRTQETFTDLRVRCDIGSSQLHSGLVPSLFEERRVAGRLQYPESSAQPGMEVMRPQEELTMLRTDIQFYHRIGFRTLPTPWLPKNILDLLEKMKMRALSEQEATHLMDLLAERVTEHYGLASGKFVAISFNARIVEAADTKIELLKKIQGTKYPEPIFVWKVGSDAFTGWKR